MRAPDLHELEEAYRSKSDDEILRLAAEKNSLTEQARTALDGELRRRKLEASVPEPPARESPAGVAPKGIGGWLLLFCLGLLVVHPVSCFVEAANENFDPGVTTIDSLLAALSFTVGVFLLAKKQVALKLVKWWFGIFLGLALLSFLADIGDAKTYFTIWAFWLGASDT